nr:MAG TPA: hypothetical protein [Caudoviricetes sp.]
MFTHTSPFSPSPFRFSSCPPEAVMESRRPSHESGGPLRPAAWGCGRSVFIVPSSLQV